MRPKVDDSMSEQTSVSGQSGDIEIVSDEKFLRGFQQQQRAIKKKAEKQERNKRNGATKGHLPTDLDRDAKITELRTALHSVAKRMHPTNKTYPSKNLVVAGNFANMRTVSLSKRSEPVAVNSNRGPDKKIENYVFSNVEYASDVIRQQEMISCRVPHRQYTFKVLVIGDPCTGKTSFIQRYVVGKFATDYKATLGVDFAMKVMQRPENLTLRLQLWDIAGQERFTSMTRIYYRDAHACVVMFDLAQRGTFLNALKWKKDLDMKCCLPNGDLVPSILLANKRDLAYREVGQGEIEALCENENFLGWSEISVKENLMVTESMRFLVDDMVNRYVELDPDIGPYPDTVDYTHDNIANLSKLTNLSNTDSCGC